MDDHEKFERLLADGYSIIGDIFPLARISPGSIGNMVNVFSIQINPEILLDSANRDKSIIMLRYLPTGHQVEILTSDERTIKRAKEQLQHQRQPVGMLIRVRCAAQGCSSADQRVIYADDLVKSLNGLWGWEFKPSDFVGGFEVVIRIETMGIDDAERAIDKLEHLLNCLAVSQEVGFHIQHCHVAPIPRAEPIVSIGPLEQMLQPIPQEEIDKILAILSSNINMDVARGLREAYVENFMPSRLARLWAAAETVFASKPEPLLTKEEIEYLINKAKDIESLRNDSDRLRKLKEALSDPNRLPLISRNERMASAISQIMGIDEQDVLSRVRTASEIRGKHVHQLSKDWGDMEASEKFLKEALLRYLAQ